MPAPKDREPTQEDFEGWVNAFRGPLVGLLASWVPDWTRAEELAQDTFAEAWVGRARFRGDPGDLKAAGAWLRGIAFHLHAATLRQRGKSTPLRLEVDPAEPEPEAPDERRDQLATAFAQLRTSHQTLLRMFYLEETSTAEVAAVLGITPRAVEGRLRQARKALRARTEHVARRTSREVSR